MNEEWYDIEGYEGYYQWSNMFRFRRLQRTYIDKNGVFYTLKEKVLKIVKSEGYATVRFCINNEYQKKIYLHLFFASKYIPNPENKKHVNHKNGDKMDYSLSNLEWATKGEDVKHAWDTGLRARKNKGDHRNAKLVLDTSSGIYYDSIIEAAEFMGYNYGTLKSRLSGRLKNNTSLICV